MEDKQNWLKAFYTRIVPYRVTFFLLLLLIIILIFIILVPIYVSPIPVPEAFVTDQNWFIPTETSTLMPTKTTAPTVIPLTAETFVELVTGTPRDAFFFDDFESGDLQSWTLIKAGPGGVAEVQMENVWEGDYSAHLSVLDNLNSEVYLRFSFQQPQDEIWVGGYFMIQQEGSENSNIPFFRLFSSTGERLITFYRQNMSNDQIWVSYEDMHFQTYGVLPLNNWAYLELHIIAAGESASTIEAYLNYTQIYATNTASLDESGILQVQIGNETPWQVFDLFVDDVSISR